MLFGKVLALAAVIAGVSAGSIKNALKPNKIPNAYDRGRCPNKIPNAYDRGVDAVATVKSYLAAQGITKVTVPTVINNPFHNDEDVVSGISGAKEVVFVHSIPRLTPASIETTEALKFSPEGIHSITGVNNVRSKLGLTGKGIKVAVIDMDWNLQLFHSVAFEHAALGGGFGPGYKVSFGYNLVGNAYNGYANTIVPDADPIDECSGNSLGTHVAGIVGADTCNILDPNCV
ncbi:hypothetical protein HDU96_006173 [Phlyctochytrium bullatum]|nr:hypothetical protein HDU96_006173 [Phlyctochytrium bullatum]